MSFHPCVSGCGRLLPQEDGHKHCFSSMGLRHAEAAFVDEWMSLVRFRLSPSGRRLRTRCRSRHRSVSETGDMNEDTDAAPREGAPAHLLPLGEGRAENPLLVFLSVLVPTYSIKEQFLLPPPSHPWPKLVGTQSPPSKRARMAVCAAPKRHHSRYPLPSLRIAVTQPWLRRSGLQLGLEAQRPGHEESGPRSSSLPPIKRMSFHPCVSGCGRLLPQEDGHKHCFSSMGLRHAEAAFVDEWMSLVRFRLSPSERRLRTRCRSRHRSVPETGDMNEDTDAAPREGAPAHLLPLGEGRAENPLLVFLSVLVPTYSIKEQFLLPPPSHPWPKLVGTQSPPSKRARMAVCAAPKRHHSRYPLPSLRIAVTQPWLRHSGLQLGLEAQRPGHEESGPRSSSLPLPSPRDSPQQNVHGPSLPSPPRRRQVTPPSVATMPPEPGPCPPPRCPSAGTLVVWVGLLGWYLEAWLALSGPSRWLIRTIRFGYAIQFASRPPKFRGIHFTRVRSLDAPVLRKEIDVLLAKDAIEPKRISECIRTQKWFAVIDLKDAYFHVSILPRHRPFLRFAFEGRTYQYKVLHLGLALSPRVFTKVVEAAIVPMREQGVFKWLILAHLRDVFCDHRDMVLRHLSRLGLQVNWDKSKLCLVQMISYLGMELDSVAWTACLTEERVQSVLTCLTSFRGRTAVPLKQFQRLLGHMAATVAVTPLGLLHMRPLQRWLHDRVPKWAWQSGTFRVKVTPHCRQTFSPWSDPAFLRAGVPLVQVSRHAGVFTDASAIGWGATYKGHAVSGLWTGPQQHWLINCLELQVARLALCHLKGFLRYKHVLVRMDSTATVAYINHQGGLRSRCMS
ncbi:hypothetical protein PO909_000543 [Leuciscus waleckii]